MRLIRYPKKDEWPDLFKRAEIDVTELNAAVGAILSDVRANGDAAVRRYSARFDKCEIESLRVTTEEIDAAVKNIPEQLKSAIQLAASNIERFHSAQFEPVSVIETTKGVTCWRRSVPIERVGIYVPGGSAPLFSTVLMLAIPAKLAGCEQVVISSPPGPGRTIDDTILFTAAFCGVTQIYKVGGAQAIAAMAYGTESIPKVDKIFGPGNQYVTCAKQLVFQSGTAIDMPAGPSEVMVLADDTAVSTFVAADLLSQAEHGPDSQVVLVSTSEKLISEVRIDIDRLLASLPRHEIAIAALSHSMAILVDNVDTAVEIANGYAPEHLILAVEDADLIAERIRNAGSVFIGNYSCESAGDYASGTNHTLPTAGFARSFSGVSLDSFVKKITFQRLSADGIRNIGPAIETMAAAEGLEAHRLAVSVRLTEAEHV